ncbi:hypothetical protein FJU30_14185 [Affinibrenneria salicis]|uniref:LysR substrate-binding domain-containing protein n=1 Tax=Affinibrenneria salicis TaxID=2590031 RepID=A0A5J5FYK5_9GAMM|nr:hypothetical protein [Affinibrenneria salicis]KAA8998838.1 hypothetical protein FJU30_14185 [Affinibrenneria salicis]
MLVVPVGNVQASDSEALRRLALTGQGLVRQAELQVREEITAGRLIPILGGWNAGGIEEIYAVFVRQCGSPLPVRARPAK